MSLPTGLYVLDPHGDPVPTTDFAYWADWREDHEAATHLARTELQHPIDGRIVVLTVFTGRDHRFSGTSGDPVLWETLVFGGRAQGEHDRYDSLQKAKEGHRLIAESIAESCKAARPLVLVRRNG